jgi:methyl-accepting chemotaxis protein
MTGRYLQLGIQTMEGISSQYVSDSKYQKYIIGYYQDDKVKNAEIYNGIKSELLKKTKTDDFFSGIYIVSDKAKSITSSTAEISNIGAGFYETELGQELNKNRSAIAWIGENQYLKDNLGMEVESFSLRLIRNFPNSKAFLVMDMNNQVVLDLLKSVEFDETGVLALVTGDGKEIVSDESDNSSEPVFTDKAFYQKMAASENMSDAFYVDYQNEEQLFMYTKIGDTGAAICALIPRSTISSQADGIWRTTFIIVIIACFAAFITAFAISGGIDKTIRYIISRLRKASMGELTVVFETKRRDEFRTLIDEINATFSNIKNLISHVKSLSVDASKEAAGVTESSELVVKTTGKITEAMTEIEHGVMQQAKEAETCLLQMDHLSEKIVAVSEITNEINGLAEETKSSVGKGTVITEKLQAQTKSTIDIVSGIVEEIRLMTEKSMRINSIVNIINDISNQTNLLSLNASIEAARAGESGRGFGVVAQEIRNLSEQIKDQTQDIKNTIANIKESTYQLSESAKEVGEVMGLQDDAVRDTASSYRVINNYMDNLMELFVNIKGSVDNIDEARIGTLEAVESISAVLEEIAASTDNVSQSANNQLVCVEQLHESSGCLSKKSHNLYLETQRFTV